MSLDWYMPKRLKPEDLECMDVRVKEPWGRAYAYVDDETGEVVCEVGDVAVYPDGHVNVWPRNGVDLARALPGLLTSAEDACMGRHKHITGWHRTRTAKSSYWRCTVLMRVPEGDGLAMALRRAQRIQVETFRDRHSQIREDLL